MRTKDGVALTVIPIPGDGWRVSDPSIDEADGTAVLGFVERSGSGFAVLPLADPAGVRTFDDFSTAVESLASRCRSVRRES